MQAAFVNELFSLLHKEGINTCLDTSGSILNDEIKCLLQNTDRVLLDIKYTTDEQYIDNVGCSIKAPLEFLAYLNEQNIPTTLRQVIIEGINDTEENAFKLKEIAKDNACVDKIELLPFRKICQTKYDAMKIAFPFVDIPETKAETVEKLNKLLDKYTK